MFSTIVETVGIQGIMIITIIVLGLFVNLFVIIADKVNNDKERYLKNEDKKRKPKRS